MARPNPAINGRFLDLPRELRDKIYRLALVQHPPNIEFAVKTHYSETSNSVVREHHFQRFRKDVLPWLGLLRVSKQIKREAGSIFYGENEFRFTSCIGIYLLSAWICQIGHQNVGYVRRIAVRVPWSGVARDRKKADSSEGGGSMKHIENVTGHMGLQPPPRRSAGMSCCLDLIREGLQSHGRLRQLRLILPDSFDPRPASQQPGPLGYDWILDPACFENLKVQLVRLHGGWITFATSIWWSAGDALKEARIQRAFSLATQLEARALTAERGLELVDMPYSGMGYWPVPLGEGERILPIEADAIEREMIVCGVRSEVIRIAFRRPAKGSWD